MKFTSVLVMYPCVLNVTIHVPYDLTLKSGTAREADSHWEETMKASINIQLVRIGLVISVDWEPGTGVVHIAPSPTPHFMTQIK
jgi:hypothetical protein